MKLPSLFLVGLFGGLWAQAEPVIDLGRLQVEGKMRGPEIQIVDPSRLSDQTAGKMVETQLKLIESRLLAPRRPAASEGERKEKP